MSIVNRQEFYVPGITLLTGDIGYRTTYGAPIKQEELGGGGSDMPVAAENVVNNSEQVQNGGEDVVHEA